MRNESPAVLGINGPASSGKTWLINSLIKLIPDATVCKIPDTIYHEMQLAGVAPMGMLYQDFKRTPDARVKTIDFGTARRLRDVNYFDRVITESDTWRTSRVVIVDNIGFPSELSWFNDQATAMILLRIDTPYNEIEPMKARARRMRAAWQNDSRSPIEHHTMLTAYDSLQMTLLLQWLNGPLTREEAGPYNGIKSLWVQYFAARRESSRGVHTRTGAAGELGGLGQAIGLLPGS